MVKDDNISYEIDPEFDFIIDEKQGGNAFIALRKVSWGSGSPKLELRKWFIGKEGNEVAGKGVSFMDEEKGPNELINVLLQHDYGNTKDVLNSIKGREDFGKSLDIVLGKIEDDSVPDNIVYYDPRDII